jgi:uncharacterized protein (UPF0333 family)
MFDNYKNCGVVAYCRQCTRYRTENQLITSNDGRVRCAVCNYQVRLKPKTHNMKGNKKTQICTENPADDIT